MAIDAHALRFLEYAMRASGPMKSTLTVGRQCLKVPFRELRSHLGTAGATGSFSAVYADDLLREYFGATTVASIDASGYEGATYVRDLNVPLDVNFPKFDTILDAGSLEHVFDIRSAFGNINRCCRVGGQILHISPANNYVGHGFYQFSPEFFFSLYSAARGFDQTEVFLADLGRLDIWWKVAPPAGSRSTAVSSRQMYALVRTKKVAEIDGHFPVQQSDYVRVWQSKDPGDPAPSTSHGNATLVSLSGRLPTPTRAKLIQLKRRACTGMHSWNPALRRVRPPSRRFHDFSR